MRPQGPVAGPCGESPAWPPPRPGYGIRPRALHPQLQGETLSTAELSKPLEVMSTLLTGVRTPQGTWDMAGLAWEMKLLKLGGTTRSVLSWPAWSPAPPILKLQGPAPPQLSPGPALVRLNGPEGLKEAEAVAQAHQWPRPAWCLLPGLGGRRGCGRL